MIGVLNGLGDSSRSHLDTSCRRWSRYRVPLMNCGWLTSKPIRLSGVPCQVWTYTWPARLTYQAGMSSLAIRYRDRASAS